MLWQQVGYMMIIYISGIQNIPGELIEAAQIDGANKVQHFKICYNSDGYAIHHYLYFPDTHKRI